ncbi:MAG: DUF2490 domain-containing protein [Bryobacterales bacterium]|nr:DUF2490 domain-containing protein [Bryobacterales bacterium]
MVRSHGCAARVPCTAIIRFGLHPGWGQAGTAVLALAMFFVTAGSGISQVLPAPNHNQSEWFSYRGVHEIKGKWGLQLDGSWRQMNDANWMQWVASPGVNYQVSPSVQITGAYAYFMTRPGGLHWNPASFPEHRMQEQITITRPLWKIPLRHRVRADHRFIGSGAGDGLERSWYRQQRVRYMLRSDLPLRRGAGGRTVLSLGIYDELFFHYGRREDEQFEKNRIYAGLTFRLSQTLAFEGGAFTQRTHRATGERESSIVVLFGVSSTAPLRRLFGRR